MPANTLSVVFGFGSKIAVYCAIDKVVVTNRPIAIESKPCYVDHERVTRRGAFHIKRPSFRVAAKHARCTLFIRAARIDRSRVDGVARIDVQHRFVEWRKLAVENCGNELM